MESVIKAITRPMIISGVEYTNAEEAINSIEDGQSVEIILKAAKKESIVEEKPKFRALTSNDMRVNRTYIIKVRSYMTKQSTPDFDFHDKWNNGTPMPFQIMEGRVLKETRGMLMMECHGIPLKTETCIRCGKPLSHPVSRLYGLGPECGSHAYINPYETEDELYSHLDEVKQKLAAVKWRGWIIKSAILECLEANQ